MRVERSQLLFDAPPTVRRLGGAQVDEHRVVLGLKRGILDVEPSDSVRSGLVCADQVDDPEVAKLLRLNGREETIHAERVARAVELMQAAATD